MTDRTELDQTEQRAQALWENRLQSGADIAGIARKYGFTRDEIVALDWADLPDLVQDDLREIAKGQLP